MERALQESLGHPVLGGAMVFLLLSICRFFLARPSRAERRGHHP